jgi:hypothetical protein
VIVGDGSIVGALVGAEVGDNADGVDVRLRLQAPKKSALPAPAAALINDRRSIPALLPKKINLRD